ncbi:uncharacterized protein [Drosophila takahashii]|uniref:uncharacterized protein n=1 Tax=Drosophila takahashii TaxID=29030 RepID=UPI003898FE9F
MKSPEKMQIVILMAIVILLPKCWIAQAEGAQILRVLPKGKFSWINKSLDELLSQSPVSAVVYFSQSKLIDEENGGALMADFLNSLTNFPRLLDVFLINCKRPINKKDCANYEFKEPGLRFYPSKFKRIDERNNNRPTYKGIEIQKESSRKMQNSVLKALVSIKLKSPGAPNFEPILSTDTVASLWRKAACKCITSIVLADQSERGSTVGRDTLLALLKREKIMVRIVDNATFFGNFGLRFLRKDHKLAIIPRSRRAIKLYPKSASGTSFASAVITFLNEYV